MKDAMHSSLGMIQLPINKNNSALLHSPDNSTYLIFTGFPLTLTSPVCSLTTTPVMLSSPPLFGTSLQIYDQVGSGSEPRGGNIKSRRSTNYTLKHEALQPRSDKRLKTSRIFTGTKQTCSQLAKLSRGVIFLEEK